jgi:hypothetical protein
LMRHIGKLLRELSTVYNGPWVGGGAKSVFCISLWYSSYFA